MEAKHIDDRIPGEIERIKAIQKSAWEEARTVVYRSCEECDKDVVAEFDVEDSDGDDEEMDEDDSGAEDEVPSPDESVKDREENDAANAENRPASNEHEIGSDVGDPVAEKHSPAPDEEEILLPDSPVRKEGILARVTFSPLLSCEDDPPLIPKRFLCHACEEEAAAKELQCNLCGDNFKALPSHDAYTAEKPVCGQCVWANMRPSERYCSNCTRTLKFQMRPHYWNEFEDEDVPLCWECSVKLMGEDDGESLDGSDVF
jgi:hypothetical protein